MSCLVLSCLVLSCLLCHVIHLGGLWLSLWICNINETEIIYYYIIIIGFWFLFLKTRSHKMRREQYKDG
jgi:hypothetical protein